MRLTKLSTMENISNDQIWKEVLDSIQVSVSPAIYNTWFTKTQLVSLETSNKDRVKALVGCSTAYVKDFIETRYFGILQDSIKKATDLNCDLMFTVRQIENQETAKANSDTSPLFETKAKSEETNTLLARAKIRPGFTFENFAVSGSNQMAYAAAEAVSQNPGQSYNPLFIWGGVGVGKTHLMAAVGHKIILNSNLSRILFCTSEEFTNDIVQGIRNKTTQNVREKYRKLNCLLVDDIQFIAGKDTAQEEFFHTFNTVTTAGGQIILTSDRPPSEISKLEERLKSRFEAGLIVDISNPDFELRCAITQIKANEMGINLESNEVQLIAGNVESARKIQGFLTKLVSASKLKNLSPRIDLIKEVLGKGSKDNGEIKARTSPEEVIETAIKYFSIGKRAIMGATRARSIARPRQILMYLLRTELGIPLQEVGRLIGGRDHTTVMHAVDKITTLASNSVKVQEDIMGIKNKLWG